MSFLVLPPTCALESVETRIEASAEGWIEQTRAVVLARGACATVDVPLPPDVHLRDRDARLRLGDGTRGRLPETRWELLPRGVDDVGVVRVHLPELVGGDRAELSFTRAWTGPVVWAPSPAAFAEISAPKLEIATRGLTPDGRSYWVAAPAPAVEARVGTAPPASPASTRVSGVAALDALTRASRMSLIPRGADGPSPVAGQEALERGAADDRGFARTVVALAAGGRHRVELGSWLSPGADAPTPGDDEIAVWWDDGSPTLLAHPDSPARAARVWTPSGVFEAETSPRPVTRGPDPPVIVHRALTLAVPGDPQLTLFPGGGSSYALVETVTFEGHGAARTWTVPLPEGHGPVEVVLRPEGSPTTWRAREDAVVLVVAPVRGRVEVVVGTTAPDAPTFGEVRPQPGELLTVSVDGPGVKVAWEGDRAWRLAAVGDTAIIPDRERLVRGLGRRFDGLSLPEPALPMGLRGQAAGWDLAALLRPALAQRVVVTDLPGDPLFPRPLYKARASGVATPLEAALIVRLYALQARIPADWALVRPAWDGPGFDAVPSGYTGALARLRLHGEARWIDPGCAVCAPFEVRPELLGAAALGPDIERTPDPPPGLWRVERDGSAVRWELSGAAALELRRALADLEKGARAAWLAERLAGPGATLVSAEGTSEAGARLALVAEGPGGDDPLSPPPPRDDGRVWMAWTGERVASPGGPPGALETEAFRWERAPELERLVVKERLWTVADVEALAAARAATPPPADGAEPPPEGEGTGEDPAGEAEPHGSDDGAPAPSE